MTKVLLVHSGNEFPIHINDCIFQLLKYNFDIHLVLSKSLHQNIENHNKITLSSIEEYTDKRYENFTVNHDLSFRDAFWLRVSNRFFIIDNYTQKNKLENFIYIENDVLLFSDFEKNIEILKQKNCEMAVCIDSEKRAVPCLIYFKNCDATYRLATHIFENKIWNDMENLFIHFIKNKDKIINFPILPENSNIPLISKSGIKNSGMINYSNLFEEFESIFDPQAIGQYLGGLDQRIHKYNTINFINETTIFDVSKLNYIWENSKPYILFNNKKVLINNIHVHSKDLKKFINIQNER